jgi:hypothetical protein
MGKIMKRMRSLLLFGVLLASGLGTATALEVGEKRRPLCCLPPQGEISA